MQQGFKMENNEQQDNAVVEPTIDELGLPADVQKDLDSLWAGTNRDHSNQNNQEEKRFEHWQGKHDKLNNEFQILKAQNDELQAYAPIARYLDSHPEALTAIEGNIFNGGNVTPQQQAQAPEGPKKPDMPSRPQGFTAEEMYTPGTPSYQYQQDSLEYQDKVLDFYAQKDAFRENQINSALEQQRQEQIQATQQRDLEYQLVNKYGLAREEVGNFYNTVGKSNDLDSLVDYYKYKSGGQNDEKFNKMNANKQALNTPPPLGTGGSIGTQQISDEDAFNLALLSRGKRRR